MIMPGYLIFNFRRRWFSGVSQEAISLHDVTSVTLEIKRHPVFGMLLGFVAVACDLIANPIGIVVAAVPLAIAVVLMWGFPLIKVSTTDGNLRRISGLPWTCPEAEWFVAAANRR
jgi:hypothetical protein